MRKQHVKYIKVVLILLWRFSSNWGTKNYTQLYMRYCMNIFWAPLTSILLVSWLFACTSGGATNAIYYITYKNKISMFHNNNAAIFRYMCTYKVIETYSHRHTACIKFLFLLGIVVVEFTLKATPLSFVLPVHVMYERYYLISVRLSLAAVAIIYVYCYVKYFTMLPDTPVRQCQERKEFSRCLWT